MLQFPFPIYIILYDNRFDTVKVNGEWVYAKDMSTYQGVASGQTSNGKTIIDIQNVADNGDVIRVYEEFTKTEFKLDISGPSTELILYRNATNANDIGLDVDNYGNELYLMPEHLISESMYLRTYY